MHFEPGLRWHVLYMPLRVGGGDVIVFSGCMWNDFHSDGYGSPRRHHRLVYFSSSSERKGELGSAVG